MSFESCCQCSIEALKILSELQNVHAVVNVETILDLIQRVCTQGSNMVQCKDCIKSPQSSIVALPALSKKCLPLLEALCSAYDISTQPGFFDSAMLAFEQPPLPFICIRSKVTLGETELDESESRLLVRTVLGQSLVRLVQLMEGLKGILLVMSKSSHTSHNSPSTLRACELSVDTTISRLAVLMQIIEGDSDNVPLLN
ncbi:hypothetical protein PENSUB_13277 [Penicillium subrubescens]|uniref:Uncharacterized protein n=1 Tax=Penicillium subrubescens TaxID=1316194 RepID=A0A1Q5SRF1_9EURO|nr:hypothetical protein PENSUB_13277 [Penicillium subrubescens]